MWKIQYAWIIFNKSRQRSTYCDLLSHKHTAQSNEYKFIGFRQTVSFPIFFNAKFETIFSWIGVFNTLFSFRYNESVRNSEHSKNENHFRSNQPRNRVVAASTTMGIKDLDALAKTIKRKICQSVFYCLFLSLFFFSLYFYGNHFTFIQRKNDSHWSFLLISIGLPLFVIERKFAKTKIKTPKCLTLR